MDKRDDNTNFKDDEDEKDLKEVIDSVCVLITATILESTRFLAHVRPVGDLVPGQGSFIGCNRQMPSSKPVSTDRARDLVLDLIEYRHCNVEFPKAGYVNHLHDQHDDDDPPLTCFHCREGFQLHCLQDFGKHVGHCAGFLCPKCPKIYTREGALREHDAHAHLNLSLYVCNHQGWRKSFKNALELRVHQRIHTPQTEWTFACTHGDCGAIYSNQSYLHRHEQKHINPWPCDGCYFIAANETDLKFHQDSDEAGAKFNNTCSQLP